MDNCEELFTYPCLSLRQLSTEGSSNHVTPNDRPTPKLFFKRRDHLDLFPFFFPFFSFFLLFLVCFHLQEGHCICVLLPRVKLISWERAYRGPSGLRGNTPYSQTSVMTLAGRHWARVRAGSVIEADRFCFNCWWYYGPVPHLVWWRV